MSQPGRVAPSPRGDVAIIGMACVFPGAADVRTYWQNIIDKVDAISDPPEEWQAALFYDPTSGDNDRVYCKRGGWLGELARFDPLEYGVMPNSIDGGEPDQFLALRVAHEALADAGYLGRPVDRERIEVIIGRGTYINRGFTTVVQHGMVVDQTLRVLQQLHPEHSAEDLQAIKRELKASLPPFNAEMAPGLVPNVISGRIANRLDLMGPNYTIDAACASSLIALDRAMQDLREGRSDMALVGGVHASTPAPILQIFCQLGALSRRGELRPFDEGADGTLLGEGLGFVVLKRRDDAERDGDRVYALIKAIGTASDGRALGLLAPRVEGEELALRRAYAEAGIPPRTVELIEAHGTGTLVGDLTEVQALRRVFGDRDDQPPSCALGSVKSMISHLIPAAGIAGVIKSAMALHDKVLPPTLHCERLNPKLELDATPFYINTETRPWIHGGSQPRRAGVNAFGFGGINAHAILEEYPALEQDLDLPSGGLGRWPTEVCIIEGQDRDRLLDRVRQLRDSLAASPAVELKDVAYSLSAGLGTSPCRLAVVASSTADLQEKLGGALDRLADPRVERIRDPRGVYFFAKPLTRQGTLAFLFPGEGSQYVNMLAELCIAFPEVRCWFDRMDRAFLGHPRGYLPSQVIFPPPPMGGSPGPMPEDDRLWQMDTGPESLFAASQAMLALLRRLDLRPQAVVGHSTGEYSALVAAGASQIDDEERLLRDILDLNGLYERLLADGLVPQRTLLAVGGADPAAVQALVARSGGELELAMDNCPNQLVLCGTEAAVATAAQTLQGTGAVCDRLPFGRAYHTRLFQPFCDALEGFSARLRLTPPRVDLYSCATAGRHPMDPGELRQLVVGQWAQPVRFRETVQAMHDDGVRLFVEVGPRNNLTAFTDDILRGKPHLAVASNLATGSALTQLNHLVGLLAANGATMQLEYLFARRAPRRLQLAAGTAAPPPPARRSGELRLAMGLQPFRLPAKVVEAREPAILHPRGPVDGAVPAGVGTDQRPQVMQQYLQTMEQFLTVQREVVGSFLHDGHGRPVTPARLAEQAPHPPDGLAPTPFIGAILSHTPGRHLEARCDLDLEEHLFLRDHTIESGPISTTDDALVGLPVMPLTMSMEILAEAASVLVPGRVVIGMRDVRAHRWIGLEEGRLPLRVVATADESGGVVQARIEEAADHPAGPEVPAGPLVEATVVLGDRYPDPGPAEPLRLRDEGGSGWQPATLYGGRGLFHGPSFQVVRSIDRTGQDGTEATLLGLPDNRLLRSRTAPEFLIDPVVLDGLGQVVAYWVADHFQAGRNIFPVRLRQLQLFGPGLGQGQRAGCRVRVTFVDDRSVRSDIELVGPGQRPLVRMTGWEDRRLDLPSSLSGFLAAPEEAYLADAWPAPLRSLPNRVGFRACLLRPPDDALAAYGAIWLRVLAHAVLGQAERDLWRELRSSSRQRRIEWLAGRIAAKDAVRLLMQERELRLCPADVQILPDPQGRPHVHGLWVEGDAQAPAVSISHAAGVAVALAGLDDTDGLGIDMEPIGRMVEEVRQAAFTPHEQATLASLGSAASQEWSTRLWCAKEAVGKAVGRGMATGPRTLEVRDLDPLTGRVTVALGPDLATPAPEVPSGELVAYTACEQDIVFACSVLERGGPSKER